MAQGSNIAERAQPRPGLAAASRGGVPAVALMAIAALTPAIFALTSWQPGGARDSFAAFSLFYSLPVTAIELAVILRAFSGGGSIAAALRPLPLWAKCMLGMLIVIASSTAVLATEPNRAMLRTAQMLIHLVFALSIFQLFSAEWARFRMQIWTWIVAGCCLFVVIIAAWVARVAGDPEFDWGFFSLAVTNVRQLGFYSAVGACGAIGLAAVATRPVRYAAAVAAGSVMVALSCWSGTRSSLLAIVAAYAVAAFIFPELRRRRALQALALSAIFGVILSLIVFMPADSRYGLHRILFAGQGDMNQASSGRLEMWQATLRAIAERPLFGYGESQFGVTVREANGYNHPHNVILQVLLQWGLAGFVCFFSLAALVARRFLAAARANPDALPAVLVVASLLIMSLYEGSFYHPYPIMMIAIGVAFVLAAPREQHRAQA